jgi:hypothetical protein
MIMKKIELLLIFSMCFSLLFSQQKEVKMHAIPPSFQIELDGSIKILNEVHNRIHNAKMMQIQHRYKNDIFGFVQLTTIPVGLPTTHKLVLEKLKTEIDNWEEVNLNDTVRILEAPKSFHVNDFMGVIKKGFVLKKHYFITIYTGYFLVDKHICKVVYNIKTDDMEDQEAQSEEAVRSFVSRISTLSAAEMDSNDVVNHNYSIKVIENKDPNAAFWSNEKFTFKGEAKVEPFRDNEKYLIEIPIVLDTLLEMKGIEIAENKRFPISFWDELPGNYIKVCQLLTYKNGILKAQIPFDVKYTVNPNQIAAQHLPTYIIDYKTFYTNNPFKNPIQKVSKDSIAASPSEPLNVIPNAVEAPVEIFMDTLNVQLKSDTVITINTNSLQIDTTQKVEPKPTKNIGKANSKSTKSAKKPKDSMMILFEEKPKKSLRKK